MQYGPPLYGIFWGHLFCKYGGVGVVRVIFMNVQLQLQVVGADFWEVDLDSNFSVFGVQRFTEWPGPLH